MDLVLVAVAVLMLVSSFVYMGVAVARRGRRLEGNLADQWPLVLMYLLAGACLLLAIEVYGR